MSRKHPHKQCPDCNGPISYAYPPAKRCMQCAAKFRKEPPEKHFWRLVKKTSKCWVWIGSRCKGYGRFSSGRGTWFDAHRFSWELHKGKIPKKICVLHKCDNPPCVNPSHLFLGTHADNTRDMIRKRRNRFGEKCPQAKLSVQDIKEIRALYIPYEFGFKKIAKLYAVSPSHITHIIQRKNWKHIK